MTRVDARYLDVTVTLKLADDCVRTGRSPLDTQVVRDAGLRVELRFDRPIGRRVTRAGDLRDQHYIRGVAHCQIKSGVLTIARSG
ncbi:MAG: hypothetical protein ACRDTA_15065 [Pseudonocardiaceae bacterium]